MSRGPSIEKRFKVLVEIARASHFAWREAVARCCPEVDPARVVQEMWAITADATARSYVPRIDVEQDVARQVAECIVWSSVCMGEDASVEPGERPGEWLVRHVACPWHRWHERHGLLAEDRPGCDRWFEATLESINERLGTRLRFETVSALPDGGECCLRRIWDEARPG